MRIAIDIELEEKETAAIRRIAEQVNRKCKVKKSESRVAAELLKAVLSRLKPEDNAILGIVTCHKDFLGKEE